MADQRNAKLILTVETKGASEAAAGVQKVHAGATTLQQELGKISRTDQLQKLGADMGALARKTGDVGKAVSDLDKKLKELGANQSEIQGVAGAFNLEQSGGNAPRGNVLQRYGALGRNLPSMQIPGAGGIGTDAVSNLVRLTGALGEATGAAGAMTSITAMLTPALGATAAGIAGVLAIAGPVALVLGVLGLAIKSIGDQAAAEAKAINTIVEGQRGIAERIAEGLNTEDAVAEIEVLNKKRKEEAELLARNQQVYDENINNAGALTGVLKLTSGAEEELANQITKGSDLVKTYDNDIKLLTEAQADGSLAANDAADAEKRLADERSKTALASADTAAKELQAEQKALGATAEANEKRLASIVDERAVIEKQIEVLEASGITSEEVTKKVESLNAQLGSLGKESSFITDVAMEQSKTRDAEAKAQKDAEDAAKKAAQAQEQYTKAVKSASDAYRNSVSDIGTRLTQTLSDNTTKMNRDLSSLSTKYNRDEYELTVKANRAERDALLNQQDDMADIRRDAKKDEQEALRDGDFKALYLSRTANQEALKEETKNIDKERLTRELRDRDAREDLLRTSRNQRQDRLLGYDQQNIDARTARDRDIQQARLTQQRALAVAAEGQNAGLAQISNYWKQFNSIQQQGMTQSLGMASGGKGQGAARTGANAQGLGNFIVGTFGGVIR